MPTMFIYGIDHLRDAIKRGELCEDTTVFERPSGSDGHTSIQPVVAVPRPKGYVGKRVYVEDAGPAWARALVQVGIVLIFVAVMGAGTIGGVLWLNANGLPWGP